MRGLRLSARPLCGCGLPVAGKKSRRKHKSWDVHCSSCRKLIKPTKFERKLTHLAKGVRHWCYIQGCTADVKWFIFVDPMGYSCDVHAPADYVKPI